MLAAYDKVLKAVTELAVIVPDALKAEAPQASLAIIDKKHRHGCPVYQSSSLQQPPKRPFSAAAA